MVRSDPCCSSSHSHIQFGLQGMAVTTVEGLGSVATKMHPVQVYCLIHSAAVELLSSPDQRQERIAKAHGSQCGFCTPGFVMSMYALLRNTPKPTPDQIEAALDGNQCRCTGYRPIVQGFKVCTTQLHQYLFSLTHLLPPIDLCKHGLPLWRGKGRKVLPRVRS